jgi:hypothetical protein
MPGVHRTVAFEYIQGYAAICVPARIETEINNAVKTAKAEAQPGSEKSAPRVSVNPQAISIEDPYSTNAKAKAQRASRVEAILDRIISLYDKQSIELINQPPFEYTDDILNKVKAIDTSDSRLTHGGAERIALKMFVDLTAKDDASIEAWEKRLDSFD